MYQGAVQNLYTYIKKYTHIHMQMQIHIHIYIYTYR